MIEKLNKISKEEFKRILTNNKTQFSLHKLKLNTNGALNILNKIDLNNLFYDDMQSRSVIRTQTNAIKFDNNSYLYFDSEDLLTCYKKNNFVIMIDEYFDNFDNSYLSTIYIYKIV